MWFGTSRKPAAHGDDRLRLQRVERPERDAFCADIHQAMQAARDSGEEPHALLFLHGFNVTFADGAIRAAQIGYDLKVAGATAFFSLLGHAYFAQAEALPHDIHDLMRHNEAPAQRPRITPAVHEGTAFWRLRR